MGIVLWTLLKFMRIAARFVFIVGLFCWVFLFTAVCGLVGSVASMKMLWEAVRAMGMFGPWGSWSNVCWRVLAVIGQNGLTGYWKGSIVEISSCSFASIPIFWPALQVGSFSCCSFRLSLSVMTTLRIIPLNLRNEWLGWASWMAKY